MPLETATYISDLVTSNPAASDGMNNADDHMRLIKSAVKATFPNLTGAVTATQSQLNAAALLPTNGVSVLADAGVFFKTNTTDGVTNPAAGEIDLKLAGTVAAQFMRSGSVNTFTWHGPATFDAAITAPGIVPIGAMTMWPHDVLPTVGTWCWANGGTLSRTGNGAALFALWSTRYGVGDGSTTFNVINMQEVVPVGISGMGGASSPGWLASISAGLKAVLGGLFGSDTTTLAINQLPAHDHAVFLKDPQHTHGYTGPNASGAPRGFSDNNGQLGVGSTTTPASTGITIGSVSGTANDNKTAATGSGSAVPIAQPSRAVGFIIRIG